jgi:hypothetical protein
MLPSLVFGALYFMVGQSSIYSSVGKYWLMNPHFGYIPESVMVSETVSD